MIIIASTNQYFPDASMLAVPFPGVKVVEGSSIHGCSRVVIQGSKEDLTNHVKALEPVPIVRYTLYCLERYGNHDKLILNRIWGAESNEFKRGILSDV